MRSSNPTAEDVVAFAERYWAADCAGCETSLIGHDAVLSLMLGFGNGPRCITCLARHHDRERSLFLEDAWRNLSRLACYRAGWRHSDARLAAQEPWPEARIPRRLRMDPEDDLDRDEEDGDPGAEGQPLALDAAIAAAAGFEEWDAGDRGCGELALELKLRTARLDPGALLLLRTTDLGAPADIPAWCRLTGNILAAAEPQRFLIERKPRSIDPATPRPRPPRSPRGHRDP